MPGGTQGFNPPAVGSISGATFDGTNWRAWVTAGSTPSFTAQGADPDTDTPLLFDWSGADLARLGCAPNCASSDGTAPYTAPVTWGAAATPGKYNLSVGVRDGFDPTTRRYWPLVTSVADMKNRPRTVTSRSGLYIAGSRKP